MKDTYLYFAENLGANDAGDSCMYPASNFLAATVNDDEVFLHFKGLNGTVAGASGSSNDSISIACTAGKAKELCEELVKALSSSKPGMVVFADEDNGIYFEDNVAGMGVVNITLDS